MNISVLIAGLLALTGLVTGCTTTFRTVDESFMNRPENYRRVQVLPIWFEGAGNLDHSFTTNELLMLCQRSGKELAVAVQNELKAKGYEVVGLVEIAPGGKEPSEVEAETAPLLEAVRVDLFKNLTRRYPNSAPDKALIFRTNNPAIPWMTSVEHNPFHHQAAASLTNVIVRLGATNAEAVLLVDTKVFFESQHNRSKRALWNWTGGGVLVVVQVGANAALICVAALARASNPPIFWVDPFWHDENSIQHSIALVDARTRTVLWLNRQEFKDRNPRNPNVLTETMAATMQDLPSLYIR